MVTYQLAETAYSTGPASSTPQSSLNSTSQVEKTEVTSVNSASSNTSEENSNHFNTVNTTTNETVNTTPDDSSNAATDENGNITTDENGNDITDAESTKKEEGKSNISHTDDNKTSNIGREQNMKRDSLRQHNEKSLIRKGSSSEDELIDVKIDGDTKGNADEFAYTAIELDTKNRGSTELSIENSNGERRYNDDADAVSTSNNTELILNRKPNTEQTEHRQNDGMYKPKSFIGCGTKQSNTDYFDSRDDDYKDGEDEGIEKLYMILKEAQDTIKQFQIDFQIDDSFRNNTSLIKSWRTFKSVNKTDVDMTSVKRTDYPITNTTGNMTVGRDDTHNITTKGEDEPHKAYHHKTRPHQLRTSHSQHRIRHEHHKNINMKGDFTPSSNKSHALHHTHTNTTQTTSSFQSQFPTGNSTSVEEDQVMNEEVLDDDDDVSTSNDQERGDTTVAETTPQPKPRHKKKKKQGRKNNETSTVSSISADENEQIKGEWT